MPLSEVQKTRIQTRWNRISRIGRPRFILLYGSILFVWMALSYAGLAYVSKAQHLLHEPWVLWCNVPLMLLAAYALASMYYWSSQRMAKSCAPTGAAT